MIDPDELNLVKQIKEINSFTEIDRKHLSNNDLIANNSLQFLGKLSSVQTRRQWLQHIIDETTWEESGYEAFGRWFDLPRQQSWVAEPSLKYRYSDNLLANRPWSDLLLTIKQEVEQLCSSNFNSVLLTLYRHGNDSVDWHCDDELELGSNPIIASLSLGESRYFCIKHKQSHRVQKIVIEDGDLWLMHPDFQKDWLHAILPEHAEKQLRLNLTFRKVYPAP